MLDCRLGHVEVAQTCNIRTLCLLLQTFHGIGHALNHVDQLFKSVDLVIDLLDPQVVGFFQSLQLSVVSVFKLLDDVVRTLLRCVHDLVVFVRQIVEQLIAHLRKRAERGIELVSVLGQIRQQLVRDLACLDPFVELVGRRRHIQAVLGEDVNHLAKSDGVWGDGVNEVLNEVFGTFPRLIQGFC